MKDAKAAADKLARQVSKTGLQSLECVLVPSTLPLELDNSTLGRKVSLTRSIPLQTIRNLDMNESPLPLASTR